MASEETFDLHELERNEAYLVQKSLLPRQLLRAPTFEISYRFRAFGEVSGDFLDYFYLADRRLGLYLGDVVGKGLPAAMYAALAMGILRGIHKTGEPAAAVLEAFNRHLRVRLVPNRFCATQYAVFDPVTLELHLANAGLPLPLHISSSGCQPLGKGGLPSGLFDSAQYDQHTVRLAQGDAVLFATDGLHETFDQDGPESGLGWLVNLCAEQGCRSPHQLLDYIFKTIEHFPGRKRHDDVAAVVLELSPRSLGAGLRSRTTASSI
jgi:sigma-B regulation protein RsbU (phosphoserine phosphatase)